MTSIGRIDFTNEICAALRDDVLKEYLPDEFLEWDTVDSGGDRPPAIQTWTRGSAGLVARSAKTPALSISAEPPGGATFGPMGTGVPSGAMMTVHGDYLLHIIYVLDYRPTEVGIEQVARAASCIAAVLAKYAVTHATTEPCWKGGVPTRTESDDGSIIGPGGDELIYLYGSVQWKCTLHAGPPLNT